MIEMHIGKRDRFATPKTPPILAIILLLRLFISERTFRCTSTVIGDSLLAPITFRIVSVIFLAFVRIKAMEFALCLCHFCFMFTMVIKATLARQIKMAFPIALLSGSGFIGVCLRPLALVFVSTDFAPRSQAIRVITTSGEVIRRCGLNLAAVRTRLKQGQLLNHSASLSLSLSMLSAGGETNRRSGATLADTQIIPQMRAEC